MATNASDIKTAVDMLPPEDFVDGVPKLEAVQRVCGDTTLTADAVAAALKPADSTKVETKAANPPAPDLIASVATNDGADNTGAMHSVDPDADKEDGVTKPLDPNDVKRAAAAKAAAALAETQAGIDELTRARAALDDKIQASQKDKGKLEAVIEANTIQLSDAEMVKKIQAQTQERLLKQAEAKKKLEGTMNTAGVRTFASPLDQALANGAKRSKVMMPGGKVFEAPHPRSPAGVAAYAGYVHGGQPRHG